MAKRKRLTPANPMFFDPAPAPQPAMRTAPIADVAREASHVAAAEDMARTLTEARQQGRMVVEVPLSQVQLDYLVRDRLALDEEEMTALIASLRARGQQTPVELTELAPGRYGLISGWRRCTALTRLHDETGDPRFASVLGLIRQPKEASEAYIAMVEENEIRVGLSYYERARIAARAAERQVFEDERSALRALFHNASRARRSKIGSFLTLVDQLDGVLQFPEAIPERLGLALAKALQGKSYLAGNIAHSLQKTPPKTPEEEMRALQAFVAHDGGKPAPAARSGPVAGVSVQMGRDKVTLSGQAVTPALVADLKAWLAARGVLD